MEPEEQEIEKATALELIRQAIRDRNLGRLREGFERRWPKAMIRKFEEANARFRIFKEALAAMSSDERKKAFAWTWDCYHPLMSDLAAALKELDGHKRLL